MSSPMAQCIYRACSSHDTLTLHLATGPQFGSVLAIWITQASCIHAAGLGFPLGHTAEHWCAQRGCAQALGQHTGGSHHVQQRWGNDCSSQHSHTGWEAASVPHILTAISLLPGQSEAAHRCQQHSRRAQHRLISLPHLDYGHSGCPGFLNHRGAPGSSHLQPLACLKAALAAQISTTGLENH